MLMPGRYVNDTTSHCLTTTVTKWVSTTGPPPVCFTCTFIGEPQYGGSLTEQLVGGIISLKVSMADTMGSGVLLTGPADVNVMNELTLSVTELVAGSQLRVAVLEDSAGVLKELGSTLIKATGRYAIQFVPTNGEIKFAFVNQDTRGGSVTMGYALTTTTQTQQTMLVDICDTVSDRYRFGFNGQEKVNEWAGVGNHLAFEARGYDSRIGRWYSVDPLVAKYPSLSPFNLVANNPILFKDPDGEKIVIYYYKQNEDGNYIQKEDGRYLIEKVVISSLKDLENANEVSGNSYYVGQTTSALKHLISTGADKEGIISALITNDKVSVSINYGEKNAYDEVSRKITWNSEKGLRWKDKKDGVFKYQSPAVQIYHELGHAFRNLFENIPDYGNLGNSDPEINKMRNSGNPNDKKKADEKAFKYFQKSGEEEKNVMKRFEQPASEKLGEDVRSTDNYSLDSSKGEGLYETKSSTTTEPR